MKLYYATGACSIAVRIILNEMNAACDFEKVILATKKTESGKDYFTINPKGVVPALQTDQGELLTEGIAINQYLADTFKATHLLPPMNEMKRYHVLEWQNYIATELHKGMSPLFNPKFPQSAKDEIVIPAFNARLTYIDGWLKDHKYLLGDAFMLPDAYLFFVLLTWTGYFKFNIHGYAYLEKYFHELMQRPAVQKALKDEGLI